MNYTKSLLLAEPHYIVKLCGFHKPYIQRLNLFILMIQISIDDVRKKSMLKFEIIEI